MYSYEELEKIYYRRKFLKIFFISLIIVAIGVGGYFVLNLKNEKPQLHIEINNSKEANKSKKEVNKTNIKKISHKNIKISNSKPLVLNFILPKIDFKDIKEINKTKKEVRIIKETNKTKEINKTIVIKKPKPPVIIEHTLTLKDLIKSYQSFPTLDKAIQISNLYLAKGDIIKAKEWALKANNIDPSDYRSWIIFAKILIKQNKTQDAKKILSTYMDNYGYNSQIENFLRSIK